MKLINFKLLTATILLCISYNTHAKNDFDDRNKKINIDTIIKESAKELFFEFLEQPTEKEKNYYSILRRASNVAGESGQCSIMATKMLQIAEDESEKFSNSVTLALSEQIKNKENLSLGDIKKLNIYQKIITLSNEKVSVGDTLNKIYSIRKLADNVNECINNFQELEKKKNII